MEIIAHRCGYSKDQAKIVLEQLKNFMISNQTK